MRRPGRRAQCAATVVAAFSATACQASQDEPCTQADLHQPAPVGMPAPVVVTQTRHLNTERLDPLPPNFKPHTPADAAWKNLRHTRSAAGGGRDELLLGLFTGKDYPRVPAWVLFTTHTAERLDPLPPLPNVKTQPNQNVCVFVDVLTALNANTGDRFYGSTSTSNRPARVPSKTTPRQR